MLIKSNFVFASLFQCFLFIIGLSIGVAFCVYLKISFSFPVFIPIPSLLHLSTIPTSIPSTLPTPIQPPQPPSSPLMQPPPQSPPPPLLQPSPPIVQMEAKNITSLSNEITNYTTKSEALSLTHNMSDNELFMRASERVPEKVDGFNVVGKVAFMFLTPGPLPLAPFWEIFFKGNEGKYSIYIHSHPSYNESFSEDSVFFGRIIPSQAVYWGTISMIDAERRALANALLEKSNQRFVLLSDSCIPVFNFTTIYNYLMGTNQSFLQSFDYPHKSARGRYNQKMWPTITIEQWRKGSQWFEIHRDLAVEIVTDSKYYKVFQEFCHSPCYNDEHYLPTLVNILSPGMNTNRSITRVDWSRGGIHPRKFGWIDVNVELLNEIRSGSECTYNGNVTNVCFLFARKFLPSAIRPLLKFAQTILGNGP